LLSKQKKKGLCVCVLLLISGVGSVTAAFGSTDGADTLSGYLELALENNDALQRARAEFRVSTEKNRQVGVLPDPKLAVQYYLEPVETRTGPQNASIGISQSFPWFNKLALQRTQSDHDVVIAGASLAAVELDVARQVKEAYVEYGFLGRSQQSIADNLELLRYLEGVARSRYVGGKTTFFDVLKIQIELAKSQEKSLALADQARPLRVYINNLLGTEPERVRTIPGSLPQVVLSLDEEAIHSLALDNAPLLHAARQRIAKARTGKELAEKDFYPDFNFSLKTILTGSAEFGNFPDSGTDPIIAGLTFNLPIFRDRRHGKVAEQVAKISSAQSFQQQQTRLLTAKIEQNLFAYRESQRKFSLYQDDLLPKVKQQLEVAVNGFQSGETTILELIDAEQNLLTFELAESRAAADRALAVARLESQAGVVLGSWN
jgi:outer membrane protein, heavy metal efflux system